jgi:hypothetical protein
MGDLRQRTWQINGQRYADTLEQLIDRGILCRSNNRLSG